MSQPTLIDQLEAHARHKPDERAIRFRDGDAWKDLSWRDYREKVLRAAAGLERAGLKPGEHVFILEAEPELGAPLLLGCWAIGAIPTMVGLPQSLDGLAPYSAHVAEQAARWSVSKVIVNEAFVGLVESTSDAIEALSSADLTADAGALERRTAHPIALVQLSSGTTAEPKGVVITHDKLLRHLTSITAALPPGPSPSGVTWLPLYHDMGLIGGLLYPLFNGFEAAIMSPLRFLERPLSWLEAISEMRATITPGPPSAFALLQRHAPVAEKAGLRLDTLRTTMVGAEPISPKSLRSFADAFRSCGFPAESYFPVYGLAEATVAVSFPEPGRGAEFQTFDREALWRGEARVLQKSGEPGEELTALGRAIQGVELRICDADGSVLDNDRVGEIQVRTDSGMEGYHRDEESTRAAFDGDWLKTGDIGFEHDGRLFVVGRSKELIIRAGLNISPAALEEEIRTVPGIRGGRVAVVGIASEARGTERIVVVAERRTGVEATPSLRRAVVDATRRRGVVPDRVVLVDGGSLPKTTSGKLMRQRIKDLVKSGELR